MASWSVTIAQSYLIMSGAIVSYRGRSSTLNLKCGETTKLSAMEWPKNFSPTCPMTKWTDCGLAQSLTRVLNRQCAAVTTCRGPISVPVQNEDAVVAMLTRPMADHGHVS